MNNYSIFHLHSMSSNPTAGTGADSITKFEDYLDKAQELEMKAIAFSEHGNIFNWVKKKKETEKRGLKYIHANEVYLTEHIDKEKGLIRDNYHYMLLAKNFEGVKELNILSGKAFDREDGHFYYNPRITFDELFNTSDNIIMTSACLASPLWRALKNDDKEKLQMFQDFFVKNKHRAFLEVQYHNHPEQIEFNKWLLNFSKESGVPLIAGTDTHALNKEHQETRKVFLKAKGANYGDEDLFDLTFKNYEELVDMYKQQGALPESDYLEAIENTNVMADMVEEFSLDSSPKYPQLYDKPIEVFKQSIQDGIKKRGINEFPKEKKAEYLNRVKEEFAVYKKLNTVDYMLLQKNVIDWCHDNDIYQGYGRGSVNGSLIAYILGITEMDSIKYNLNFYRFLNPERISLADIDVDIPSNRRREVIDYLASIKGVYFSEIVTFNTVAMKGAIREVGRALNIPLATVDEISKNIETNEAKYRSKYEELFRHVDNLIGTVVSVGSHPSGFVVSPVPLDESVGLFYTKESKYPVSQINMKELDGLNYVKLDVLGLENMQIINETCSLSDIERLTPDNIDFEDEDVWRSIRDNTLGVFQWESDTAQSYIKHLLSEETIEKIKGNNKAITYLDLLSVGNGAIRPSGASYRDRLANGEFNNNGHEGLNNLLKDTQGYLVYQEQIMKFLTDFCGFSGAGADSVRRGLSKKEGTEQFLPKIEEGFINTMKDHYGLVESESRKLLAYFLKVIDDASSYGFSVNHSQPYSAIGYACGWLRYYYPLEFITVMMNINADDKEKTSKIYQYAKLKNIKIKDIEFGKSRAKYSFDKKDNSIYKGVDSIKFLNESVAENIYQLKDNTYNTFTDLIFDIHNMANANFKQLRILTMLNYFSKFGKNKKLLNVIDKYESRLKNKGLKEETKLKRLEEIREFESERKEESLNIKEQIKAEIDFYGYETTIIDKSPDSVYIVTEIDRKYTPRLRLYKLKDGSVEFIKCYNKNLKANEFGEFAIIQVKKRIQRDKKRRNELGEYVPTGEKEMILDDWNILR
ncbi:DNA polymerase III subunit alpha [Bacillus sp. Wb]